MIPGNHLDDNWYMVKAPNPLNSLQEFKDAIVDFSGSFKLQNEKGESIYIRMSNDLGVIIIDSYDK